MKFILYSIRQKLFPSTWQQKYTIAQEGRVLINFKIVVVSKMNKIYFEQHSSQILFMQNELLLNNRKLL